MSALPIPSPLNLAPEQAVDGLAVEALITRAFGPGRFVKAAERLREGRTPVTELSFVARLDGAVVGCVRLWPVTIGATPALLLGPFAVEGTCRSHGLGAALIQRAQAAAASAGHALILLVGDPAYFAPLGFSASPARRVIMPGPVHQGRVMVQALKPGAADNLQGLVRAA
jgi:predicted N-acetyltransferase YhbS